MAAGIWLAATKGPSDFAFAHPEGVWPRLVADCQSPKRRFRVVLLAARRAGIGRALSSAVGAGLALLGFCARGIFWGYLAGGLRVLDFLQPGRHTYACYTALAVAGGAGSTSCVRRLRSVRRGRTTSIDGSWPVRP